MGAEYIHVKGDSKSMSPANEQLIIQTKISTSGSVQVAPQRIRKMYNANGFAYSNLVSIGIFLLTE